MDSIVGTRDATISSYQSSGSLEESKDSLVLILDHSEDEIDNDSSQQSQSQYGWTNSIIETTLTPLPNTFRSPMKCE